ncbi:MAG: NUDIX hydrolase [Chloroflexi bacterium]|nr:NUDIX hydrolase [Chloroflexota bacterium]
MTADQATVGIQQAVEAYGPPARRAYSLNVQEETLAYWRGVSRRRKAEVVLVLRRPSGRYLVHTKAFYPSGVYRLLSGGVKLGEDLTAAVYREAWEETGLEIQIERFLGILAHRFIWQGQSVPLTSYVFLVAEVGGTLAVQDVDEAITGFREVDLAGLLALAEELESLSGEWQDWGRFRAIAHRFTVEVLTESNAST